MATCAFAQTDSDSANNFYFMKSTTLMRPFNQNAKGPDGGPNHDNHLDDQGYQPWMFGVQHQMAQWGRNTSAGLDACYLNAGHTANNHLDGYCAMGYFSVSDDDQLGGIKVTIEAGPYFTYNTTTRWGGERDEKALGLIYAAVIEKELSKKLGVKVRAEFVQANIPHGFDGKIFLVGLTKSLGGRTATSQDVDNAMNQQYGRWSFSTGVTQPNYAKGKMGGPAFEIERTHVSENDGGQFIYSGMIKHEGNSKTTDRNGIAGLVGYEFKSPSGMVVGGEAGPYLEHDEGVNHTKLDALTRVYVGQQIRKIIVTLVYERVTEFTTAPRDADGFMVQVSTKR